MSEYTDASRPNLKEHQETIEYHVRALVACVAELEAEVERLRKQNTIDVHRTYQYKIDQLEAEVERLREKNRQNICDCTEHEKNVVAELEARLREAEEALDVHIGVEKALMYRASELDARINEMLRVPIPHMDHYTARIAELEREVKRLRQGIAEHGELCPGEDLYHEVERLRARFYQEHKDDQAVWGEDE